MNERRISEGDDSFFPFFDPLLSKLSAKPHSCYTEGKNTRSEDRKVAIIAVLADKGWMLEQ
jgi:hypothetical protein